MASSTGEKFNRLINAKEQIRKSINKKGVRVTEDLPFEQYANKINNIPLYDENLEDAGFLNFVFNYFNSNLKRPGGYSFYGNNNIVSLSAQDITNLNRMGFSGKDSLDSAFAYCSKLVSVAPVYFNNSNSYANLFRESKQLETVNVTADSNFTTTERMFESCSALSNLTLNLQTSSTDTGNFTCTYMFSGVNIPDNSIASLYFPNYRNLFYGSKITSLNFLNNWDLRTNTGEAPSWDNIFYNCTNLQDFTFPTKLKYTPPYSLAYAFTSNKGLKPQAMPTLQNFFDTIDLSKVTNMTGLFSNLSENFNGLNLTIHMPAENNTCNIDNMFNKSYTFSGRGPIEYFSYDGVGSAESLFSEYSSNLDNVSYHPTTSVGTLNLPNITKLRKAFYYNSYLTDITQINIGDSAQDIAQMFYYCKRLTSIPLFNTKNVTDMSEMFFYCQALTTVPQFNTQKVTTMYRMFAGCTAFTTVPQFNTSNCSNFGSMFSGCTALTTIPALDLGSTINSSYWANAYNNSYNPLYQMFYNCSNLEEIHCINIKTSLDISYSTKFTREALLEIVGNLVNVGADRTLHMGATNLAKLTAEDIAIATAKGWTLD